MSSAKIYRPTKIGLAINKTALQYLDAELSFLPISGDGSKRPAFNVLPRVPNTEGDLRPNWSVLRQRLPRKQELAAWYLDQPAGEEHGLAIITGTISNHLEVIDFDSLPVFTQWLHRVETEYCGLLQDIVWVRTPRPGMHGYYRCETIGGNAKLARIAVQDATTGRRKPQTIIELKGEGGYCLAPPTPAHCHPRQRPYEVVSCLPLTAIPWISVAQRALLHDSARLFNTWTEPAVVWPKPPTMLVAPTPSSNSNSVALRPGDDFKARASWLEILTPHGWRCLGIASDGSASWCRPNKAGPAVSATTNYGGSDLLYVFSTNAEPFASEQAYNKFQAYTLLEHYGDFRAAAAALRAQGFGHSTIDLLTQLRTDARFQS